MEKLFGLPQLLISIYEKLTFTDQIRLAQVHTALGRIFANFILPLKYRKLKIRYIKEITEILVSNDEDDNCMLLTHGEVKSFLQFVNQIKDLHIMDGDELSRTSQTPQSFCAVSGENLQNLTCLHYENLLLTEKHLLLVAKNISKLRELRLNRCKNESNREPLMIGQGLQVSTLEQIKNLKTLIIRNEFTETLHMSVFCDLITKVPLECLQLKASLVRDMHDNVNDPGTLDHQHLKEFEIELNSRSLKFLESKGILRNLLKLHIITLDNVSDLDLQIIARACENLECLTFDKGFYYPAANFQATTNFPIPPNLKELYLLKGFQGLKCAYLKRILTTFKIEKFICNSRPSEIEQFFSDIRIFPQLQVLNLCGINTPKLSVIYSNNNTLKELHWYEDEQIVPDDTENRECLKTCRNLAELFIHSGYVPIDIIFELKQLQKLEIPLEMMQLNWSYLIGILKHTSLKEINIKKTSVNHFNYTTNVPIQGFPSTITFVNISFDIFEISLDFWLNMLLKNPKMTIKCEFSFHPDSLLKKLIHHENLPKDLIEIKVWGFNLNCNDLRQNFLATICPLWRISSEMRWNQTIILKRKQN